jgi:hypothetical protein
MKLDRLQPKASGVLNNKTGSGGSFSFFQIKSELTIRVKP